MQTEQKTRRELLEELEQRYCNRSCTLDQLIYFRKRYAWLIVVSASQIIKRFFDIIFSAVLGIVFSPIMAIIACCIKAYDKGPILYISPRVGQYGKEFPFLKFRSMKINAAEIKQELQEKNQHKEGVTFKMKNDPRITPTGRWIRKGSLDELPQLWSVFIGDMSLVGPRPPLPEEVAQYQG